MNRNTMYAVIALGIIAAIGAYYLYERQHSSGIDVKVNDSGLSIETH
jgi:hypothetical protein